MREDWELATSRWQEAIRLLKAVPTSSPDFGGIPVIEVTFDDQHRFNMMLDTGASQTLITESMATALNLPVVGMDLATIADGSVVTLPVALVDSQKINSRVKTDVVVSVAPPAQTIGLLGQDFFEGYDVTVKKNVIEFRRQRYSN
ncbi:retropepsin-like aspartic protease family protein [Coleofasciculus chthonoplastes]|uniref:retropepsin-like aspartic protease family protein n=1 Tax=Coleofasciculus chthonoplastes TaxID=64178 RepID=UPI0032FCD916